MDKIKFLNALESDLKYDRTLDFKKALKNKELELGVGATLLQPKAEDIVGMLFTMDMKYKGENALRYSVIVTYFVEGWTADMHEAGEDSIKEKEEVRKMLDVTVGFLRGSMFVHTKDSPLDGLTVPLISIDELQKNLKIENVKQ